MEITMNARAAGVLALVIAAMFASAACAQAPNIVVKNQMHHGARTLSIVVEEPAPRIEDTEAQGLPPVVLTPPDGGAIQGTMLVGGKQYAVTANRNLGVGEMVRGMRIVEITLDHVRLAGSARVYELDLATMQWTAGEELAAAE